MAAQVASRPDDRRKSAPAHGRRHPLVMNRTQSTIGSIKYADASGPPGHRNVKHEAVSYSKLQQFVYLSRSCLLWSATTTNTSDTFAQIFCTCTTNLSNAAQRIFTVASNAHVWTFMDHKPSSRFVVNARSASGDDSRWHRPTLSGPSGTTPQSAAPRRISTRHRTEALESPRDPSTSTSGQWSGSPGT